MLCPLVMTDAWRSAPSEVELTMGRHYSITVAEHLDESWSTWFDGLTITHNSDGTSTLEGPVRDQSALYGLIDRARDLGLTLLAIESSAPPGLADEHYI
jgi:hypothetical protein